MYYRARFLVIAMAFSLFAANLSFAGSYSPTYRQYASDLNTNIIPAIITMADQADLQAIQSHLYLVHANRQLWHETVIRALQDKASTSQRDLIAELEIMKADGLVESYHPLWIANMIIINATADAIDRIVLREDVSQISPDYNIRLDLPVAESPYEPSIANVEDALRVIHADQCWEIGITGAGRLISSIETGVDGTHPAIANSWAGLDPQYAGHPEWAWLDPVTFTSFPQDFGTHGTFMTGVMCGHNGSDTIGVAVDAHWISSAVIDRIDITHTVQGVLISLQWLADPDNDPSTVWDVPDVCCGPWGLTEQLGFPPCDDTFWLGIDGMEAAGVVAIFSAGGTGPGASTIVRPADRATTAVSNFCVGAIDNTDLDYPVTVFSSRGPSNCTPGGTLDFKPEVVGPGIDIRSCIPGNSYAIWSGTASATSFIAGVVALIRQANPDLSSDQVKQILLDTAHDLGEIGDDNAYGMGLIDAYDAVLRAQEHTCHYVPGDVNSSGTFNGIDVTFMVGYFKGGTIPPYMCPCPPGNEWYVAGDVNGSCAFNGVDVTYAVGYFGGGPAPVPCPDCPPETIEGILK